MRRDNVLFGNFHFCKLCVPVCLRDRVLRGLLRRRVSAQGSLEGRRGVVPWKCDSVVGSKRRTEFDWTVRGWEMALIRSHDRKQHKVIMPVECIRLDSATCSLGAAWVVRMRAYAEERSTWRRDNSIVNEIVDTMDISIILLTWAGWFRSRQTSSRRVGRSKHSS